MIQGHKFESCGSLLQILFLINLSSWFLPTRRWQLMPDSYSIGCFFLLNVTNSLTFTSDHLLTTARLYFGMLIYVLFFSYVILICVYIPCIDLNYYNAFVRWVINIFLMRSWQTYLNYYNVFVWLLIDMLLLTFCKLT